MIEATAVEEVLSGPRAVGGRGHNRVGVDLGADGSLPTGAAAILYLSRRNGAGDFVGNKGTGGGMTLHGTLSEGSSDP